MNLVSFDDLKQMGVSYSAQHLNRLIRDGAFPRPIKLGPSRNSRKAWLKADIDAWIKSRINQRDAVSQ
ncbi:helix-turn-helix transcriptional regulator [Rhizobium rhizogenes]|uniref:helix-turn-helix transcriptional regulator n=1 Tax=Rhizobium rhizogenes TaxID=359 RepID=UPI001572531F|nr:AlpA family phage regulatory protein [Rhizobium rhizogenes]NTG94242.1 AlpA family phage regulatory protein [Rhizobium rhizogenes]